LTVEEIPEGDTPFYCKRCISPPRIDTAADRIVPALDNSMPLGVVADMGMKFLEVYVVKRAHDGQPTIDCPNIFNGMMDMTRKYDTLPPKRFKKI